jgi:molybdate transport system substrate-binding protein
VTTLSQPLHVLSAGSLRHAFPAIIAAFSEQTGIPVTLTLAPAGLLRERIEAGEHFDLFTSANMAHPQHLARKGITDDAVCFARNSLCVLCRADLGLTTGNLLEILADPAVKIGTSTPGDDPSGDYAFEMFDLIEARQPGLGNSLKARALQLVGGRNSPPTPSGKGGGWLITEGKADLFLSYSSNARLLENDPALSIVDIPDELSPNIEYGLAVRKNAPPQARQLLRFTMSESGQDILEENGFVRA